MAPHEVIETNQGSHQIPMKNLPPYEMHRFVALMKRNSQLSNMPREPLVENVYKPLDYMYREPPSLQNIILPAY